MTAMSLLSMSYDIENRLVQAVHSLNGTDNYAYDPSNLRVWKQMPGQVEEVYFYGVDGTLLGAYNGGSTRWTRVYFAGKLIARQDSYGAAEPVIQDRLGSDVSSGQKHFPFGEEYTTTQQDRLKFATYYRDSTTALDYASQRYYGTTFGRFLAVDVGSANPANPQSWNRYSYANSDPVNFSDPTGLNPCGAEDGFCLDSYDMDWIVAVAGGDPYALGRPGEMRRYLGCDVPSGLFMPNPLCLTLSASVAAAAAAAAPPPTLNCGQTLQAAGILPTSETAIDLASVLLGENSWGYIGGRQYQNGDMFGHPTGATITRQTVAVEDDLMLDVIANQAAAHHKSFEDQIETPGVFKGYQSGKGRFTSYQLFSVGSTQCDDLTQASLAVQAFLLGGGVARTGFNQWRGVVQQDRRTGRFFPRPQRPGDFRVASTDFFTIQNP